MQRLKVLRSLVVENAGKLQELPALVALPPFPSKECILSCVAIIRASDNTPAPVVADQLLTGMCRERELTEARLQELSTELCPSQVWCSRFSSRPQLVFSCAAA
jgi:hypothetical protein